MKFLAFILVLSCVACVRIGAQSPSPGSVQLVHADGTANLGVWKGDIRGVDPRAYDQGYVLNALQGVREKKWQYVGIYTDEVIIGLAVVDVGYLGTVFAYCYDRAEDKLWQVEVEPPLAAGIHLDRNVAQGYSTYESGDDKVVLASDVSAGYRWIRVNLKNNGVPFELSLRLHDNFKDIEPLQANRPTSSGTFSFTHKAAGLPVEGVARLGDKTFRFDPAKDFAVLDYTFGFPAHHTVWRWASFVGHATDGTRVGLNLVDPIQNETINENGIWIDGRLVDTGRAIYEYDPKDPMKPWRIKTQDGRVDLVFQALGKRAKNIDLGLLKSVFQQPFGYFTGTIQDETGKVFTIDGVPGVVEDHEAKW